MIKSELVQRIAEHSPHLYQRDVENIVNAILDEIIAALARGDRVELRGFGAFSVKNRPARAEDQLKVAIGQINNWENQAPTLGQDAGIFKRHNLVLENVGTQGAGETMQPVIAGSADLGAGVGVAGVLRAFARGAPVRILLPAFTGTGDLYWYVKAD